MMTRESDNSLGRECHGVGGNEKDKGRQGSLQAKV